MVTPFKTKDINEEITSKDIKSLMEQANYTNKYLQVLGESINREKVSPKHKTRSKSRIPQPEIHPSLFLTYWDPKHAKQALADPN